VLVDIDPEDPEKLSFTSVETPDQPPLEMVDEVEQDTKTGARLRPGSVVLFEPPSQPRDGAQRSPLL
jgi:hypothetical protein